MRISLRLVVLAIVAGHSSTECELPTLNGAVIMHKIDGFVGVRFECSPSFELIGSNSSVCLLGKWTEPVPLCATSRCTKPSVENGIVSMNKRSTAVYVYCEKGYTLAGHYWAYCRGSDWNRSLGECLVPDKMSIPVFCDFETDACGWTNGIHTGWSNESYFVLTVCGIVFFLVLLIALLVVFVYIRCWGFGARNSAVDMRVRYLNGNKECTLPMERRVEIGTYV